MKFYLLYKNHGLYDPVLDDFEAIYEPTERADSDLRSEPTEVPVPRCIDYPERPLSELTDFCPINEPKSRTASPFIPNTKPYRPFSTEPLNVPTLEDPIILNPDFHDDFGDILEGIDVDKVETKFKLPISEKYDPSYRKKVDGILSKSMEREIKGVSFEKGTFREEFEINKVTCHKESIDIKKEERQQKNEIEQMVEDIRFEEKMKLELDMEKIERTALDVVDESIERAVSVTEEIQKEVEVELRASATRETKEDIETEESKRKESVAKTKLISSALEVRNEVTEEYEDHIEDAHETHETRAEKAKELLYVRENKNKIKTHEVKTEFERRNYEDVQETRNESEGKQKAFDIGLQTIPNIRGMAQSSHHFDLLMRTFFIHLTDVMVALSRFILTQPAFELELKAERVIRDKLITGLEREEVQRDMKQEYHKDSSATMKREVKVTQEETRNENCKVFKENQEIIKHEEVKKKSESSLNYVDEETDKKHLSGAQMAQMTHRKPKELTHRMDAVITEFETKTGIDERLEVNGEKRRSRSRSRIEEEVMNESDPLEWLDKVNNKHVSETNISTSKKNLTSHTESKKSRRSEHESREVRTTKSKPGKQMYVAIVEAHTYTNKDAILEEQMAEISETASIESTEEINTALEEKQQAVEVISQALDLAVAESTVTAKQDVVEVKDSRIEKASLSTEESYRTAAVETAEIRLESSQAIKETKVTKREAVAAQELRTSVASESIELVEDMKAKTFEVTEVTEVAEKKAVVVSEENYKETAVHSSETLLEESRDITTELKVSEKQASSTITQLAIATAETTDIVTDDSRVEIFEAKDIKSKTAIIKSEETFKTAAIETSEVALEEAVEQHAVHIETGHATVRETNNLAVAGIIENKIEEDKVIVPKPAEDGYASLKIIKQEVIEADGVDFTEISESEVNINKVEIQNSLTKDISIHKSEKLHLQTDIQRVLSQSSVGSDENNNIDTPTPSTIPPTPLTDEYVFKLQIPLPKSSEVLIKEDSPEDHEDLSIVKKKLVPHIETSIDDQIIYDPPLPTPTDDKIQPVFCKPGLKGGASFPRAKREYIREIERKSSLLASAIDETIRSIEVYKEEVGMPVVDKEEVINEEDENEEGEPRPEDELPGFRHIAFQPELAPSLPRLETPVNPPCPSPREPYTTESGEPLGSVQGIVDGLEEAMVDEEVAKELGKPGLTEDKIAELISGESEMLREAHVMGLSRVISTHMNKPDDSSVDFNKIKPLVESLKDSEVLKALNEEILKTKEEEKKKDERKWTTFLQKPQRPAPRAKTRFNGFLPQEDNEEGPYKVKIVKQPKPKVAPDYKPEDFDTGPLPWEQRALTEPPTPPVALEDPILVPEETPQFLEAVDPLPESEVPDLEFTGILLPPPQPTPEPTPIEEATAPPEEVKEVEDPEEEEQVEEEPEMKGEVEEMADQLVQNVKSMVDPHAPIQQQLAQMRAQLAALAQLPCVIQQSLEILTSHLASISQQETQQATCESKTECMQEIQLSASERDDSQLLCQDNEIGHVTVEEIGPPENEIPIQEQPQEGKITLTEEEYAALKREEEMILEEQRKSEHLKKVQEKIERESRQVKQSSGPRVGKPKPAFGPQNPEVRPLVLPGGRRWRGPKDAFNDQFIAETIQAQSEVIQGKAMGFESDRLPYDERINFMKWEKPPVSLDHLQNSEVYRMVHGQDSTPLRRVDLLTPVVAEADYRERCRSSTPTPRREEHLDIPQQLQP